MKPTRIFLDLDDVLNIFTPAALWHVGCNHTSYKPEWRFNIIRAANASHPLGNFTKETFWDRFDRRFWACLKKSTMCDWLIKEAAKSVGRNNVYILTSPTKDPDCLAGKLEWIQDNLPAWMHRNYVMSVHKHLCASPGSLLIDDYDYNVTAFLGAGGKAILVPRPWNLLHGLGNPRRYVANRIKCFFEQGFER